MKVGVQNGKLYLGFGSIQREFVDRVQIDAALALADYWRIPRSSGEALRFLAGVACVSESDAANLISIFLAQRIVIAASATDLSGRYSRHHLFYSMSGASPQDVQARLQGSHVLILGCGGIGNVISTTLAAAGVGQLTLVDDDVVELSNLTRQFMFTEGDVGRGKVSRLSAGIRERSQSTRVQEISRAIRGWRDLEELPRADLIVVSADSPGIVETVNRFCVEHRLVFLNVCYVNDIAVWGPFVIPGETGCWSCRDILATSEGLGARSAEVIANINSYYQVPSFAPVNLLASSLALLDIVMYLGRYGKIKSLNRRIGLWTHDLHFETQDCRRNPDCRVCGPLSNGKDKSDE
jgi:molybdopterin/thiamine biosynthesis adenylyltransferase